MKRLTTDIPVSNDEIMLNYAYVKNDEVFLRYGDGAEDISLGEYIANIANEKGCPHTSQDVADGACMECDCELAILHFVAIQAAVLRERLKVYEDGGFTPEEIAKFAKALEEKEESQ